MPNQPTAVEKAASIPKSRKSSSGLMWRMLTFSFVIFFVMIASYVSLEFGYSSVLKNKIEAVDEQAANLISGVTEERQDEIVDFYSRLANIKNLLGGHVYGSNFFTMLEANTDQGVYFSEASFSIEDNEVELTGFSRGYAELARQLEKLRSDTDINNLELESATLSQNGLVSFEVRFNVSRKLFLKS